MNYRSGDFIGFGGVSYKYTILPNRETPHTDRGGSLGKGGKIKYRRESKHDY